jgi:hypothetical protein
MLPRIAAPALLLAAVSLVLAALLIILVHVFLLHRDQPPACQKRFGLGRFRPTRLKQAWRVLAHLAELALDHPRGG